MSNTQDATFRPTPKIEPAEGKLGILIPEWARLRLLLLPAWRPLSTNLAKPIGSTTQLATIRLGKRTDNNTPKIKDFVPLAGLDDLVFGGWDIFEENCYEAAVNAAVLDRPLLDQLKEPLSALKPMPAVFDSEYVKRINGPNQKPKGSKMEHAEMLMDDIRQFKARTGASRLAMIWCGSTEVFHRAAAVHQTRGDVRNGPARRTIPRSRPARFTLTPPLNPACPIPTAPPPDSGRTRLDADGARPQRTDCRQGLQDRPDVHEDAARAGLQVAHAGRFRLVFHEYSGQSGRRSAGRSRVVPVQGRNQAFGALEQILQPDLYPDLYKDIYHKVRINYYPPRGDNKEGWDNIDIFGWLGYPMQIKVDFLCRDSILAAPLALDLVLFMDLAQRAGMRGVQEWLSFYFKGPMTAPGLYPEHDIFIQLMKLKNTLRWMKGEN